MSVSVAELATPWNSMSSAGISKCLSSHCGMTCSFERTPLPFAPQKRHEFVIFLIVRFFRGLSRTIEDAPNQTTNRVNLCAKVYGRNRKMVALVYSVPTTDSGTCYLRLFWRECSAGAVTVANEAHLFGQVMIILLQSSSSSNEFR